MRAITAALVAMTCAACARVEASRPSTEVEMKNVDLHVTSEITLHIRHLRGQFIPARAGQAPYLDDKSSYTVAIDSGDVAIDLDSLNALLRHTMEASRANVSKLRVSLDDQGRLEQKGVVRKGVPIPFVAKGTVGVTEDGKIRVQTESVKGYGVPMKPAMKLFSIEMDDLLKVETGHGVSVVDNALILDPAVLLPPPAMRGRLTAVRIEHGLLVQRFGGGEARKALTPAAISRNHLYWRGGQLAFGKLTMADTDLELIDDDPDDPFDFSVDHWNDQLVAGYSKNTAGRGLKAHVPDYDDLQRQQTLRRQR
jgi:hypothetical protein